MKYIETISALLAPLTALFLAWLAYKDYQSKQEEIKLLVYERRYKIYKATENLLKEYMIGGKIGRSELDDFLINTNEREFLFNDEVNRYIEEIGVKLDMSAFFKGLISNKKWQLNDDEKNKYVNNLFECDQYLHNQLFIIEKIFKKYLQVNDLISDNLLHKIVKFIKRNIFLLK